MILKIGLELDSDLLNNWRPQLGIPKGVYKVNNILSDYFTVLLNGYLLIPVGRIGFEDYYLAYIKNKTSQIIDYKKEIDKEISNYSMRLKFEPKDTDALMREYGVETVKMTSGRSVPIPKYPKGGYIGMDWGNVDSYGDIIMGGTFGKTSKISSFLPRTGVLTTAEKTRFFDNLKKQLTDNKNLNNNLQDGKATNLPRKNPKIKKGLGFTGRTITSRTGPTTITVGYIGD